MADSQTATSAPEFKSAHFIGIGGAGMSGIALVLHERGYAVTGSDLKTSRYIRQLTRAGVKVHVGHEAATIDEVKPDVVVVSTAIPESNPELVRARELGIPVWPRAKMLSALGHGYTTVAVAGTHGKTTTSSMCATMLDRMGLDPSFLIGGIVEGYDTNGKNGSGDYFVAEADESDSSFLFLNPNVVIVTNVEADHLDHYSGIEEIEATFAKFMSLVGEDGTVIVCGEDPHLVELAKSTGRHVLSYGFAESNDIVCMHPDVKGIQSDFIVRFEDGTEHAVEIKSNPGRHNMLNATAVLTVAHVLGLDIDAAAKRSRALRASAVALPTWAISMASPWSMITAITPPRSRRRLLPLRRWATSTSTSCSSRTAIRACRPCATTLPMHLPMPINCC